MSRKNRWKSGAPRQTTARSREDAHHLKLAMHETLVNKGVPRGVSWQSVCDAVDNGVSGPGLRRFMDRLIMKYTVA